MAVSQVAITFLVVNRFSTKKLLERYFQELWVDHDHITNTALMTTLITAYSQA